MSKEENGDVEELLLALTSTATENATQGSFDESLSTVVESGESRHVVSTQDLEELAQHLEVNDTAEENPFDDIFDEIKKLDSEIKKLDSGVTHNSFNELLEELAALRPRSPVKDKAVFDYNGTPVILRAGEMHDIHWMDIFIVVPGLRASRLDINQNLLKLNRETLNQPIPSWFAAGERDEVLYANRLDWQNISASILDEHISQLCSFGLLPNNQSGEASRTLPENPGFEDLLAKMKSFREWDYVDGKTVFRYGNDASAYLVRGEEADIHWVDIFVEIGVGRADRLDASKRLLLSNFEMAQATPIPSWFAAGPHQEALFVNRLNWQFVSPQVLDDHIRRCVEEMGEAIIAEAAKDLQSQSHHSPTFKDYHDKKQSELEVQSTPETTTRIRYCGIHCD